MVIIFLNSTEPATFTERLELSQLIKKGEYAQLECKVTGTPEIKISWFKDDREIKDSEKYKMSLVGSTAVLRLMDVTIEDSGEYMCEAKNDAGKDTCSSVVAVKGLCQNTLQYSQSLVHLEGSINTYQFPLFLFLLCYRVTLFYQGI